MNAFQNFLNNEQARNENQGGNFGSNNVEYYKPKNEVLRLGKDKESVAVRVLPPVKEGSPEFSKEFRNTGINFTNKNGEQKFSGLVLPAEPGSSVIDPYINDWLANQVAFSRFPNRPGVRFYIHVLEYFQDNQGNLQYKQDQQGNPYIQPMEISQTAYKELISKLQDNFLAPQGAPYSFISENEAYLVRIRKAKKGETSWGLDVYPNMSLGALPQNWRDFTSDLDKLAQPTEEINPSFVNFLINKVNNTNLEHDNFKFNRDSNKLGEEPTPKQQAPSQQQVDDGLPSNLQQTQPQQQPQQQNNPFEQPQQNQQNNNPWNNLNTNDVSDEDLPFSTGNPQVPQQPQQQWEAPASVDDILADIDDLDFN